MSFFDTIIVQPIFNLLIGLYSIIPGGDFGVTLILFTILVRLALWPLVKRQLHQVIAMRKLQPELAKIKKQSKGNRQAEGVAMLELYKKHNVNPFRSIFILLVQLPIFFALYRVIQILTSDRGRVGEYTYSFLENVGPIRSIIDNPAGFNETLFGVIDLTQSAVSTNGVNIALLVIAVLAAFLQFIMSKQTMPQQQSNKTFRELMAEAAEGKQPDQSEMNAIVMSKMIKVLPLFMFGVIVFLPGALSLYYTVSNLVAVFQQRHILNQDKDELEAIADDGVKKQAIGKKATAKARAKTAPEATVTRIKAKDSRN